MTDVDSVLRSYLTAMPALVMLTGQRIYAGVDLPAGYTPDAGPAVLFSPRGGGQDFSSAVLNPSYQFRSYAATEKLARQTDQELYSALNDKKTGVIKMIRMETYPQLLAEPTTGWPFLLTFYRVWAGNN